MALVKPSLYQAGHGQGGLFRELEVIRDLEEALPQGFEIFHSVFIHNTGKKADEHCEIDLVVMAPDGRLLLMEVKAGEVHIRGGNMYKTYGRKEHNVDRQCENQYVAMVRRLKSAELRTDVISCLVLPDHSLESTDAVSMPRDRIIDAGGYRFLGERVLQMFDARHGGRVVSDPEAIRNFLENQFHVLPDMTVLGQHLQKTTHRLSDGLASWVPRITAPSGVIRVQATAGSGKTQLALRLIGDAIARGVSVLYVCFNRTLADHMIQLASPKADVASFHELSMSYFRRHHAEPDFSDPKSFELVAQAFTDASAGFAPQYDIMLIDEAQDFEHRWLQALPALLRETGTLYVLEDEQQQLYRRDPFEIADAVLVRSDDNYRSPRAICDVINALGLTKAAVNGRSPYAGDLPVLLSCEDEAGMMAQTEKAVSDFLVQGFHLHEIVVLSAHGRQRSRLASADRLAGHPVRRFTGNYDQSGNALWTEGDLLVESVYRFKGQSARAVVLTEIDFTEIGAREKSVLFVGMTRATMALTMVMTASADALLTQLGK